MWRKSMWSVLQIESMKVWESMAFDHHYAGKQKMTVWLLVNLLQVSTGLNYVCKWRRLQILLSVDSIKCFFLCITARCSPWMCEAMRLEWETRATQSNPSLCSTSILTVAMTTEDLDCPCDAPCVQDRDRDGQPLPISFYVSSAISVKFS